MKRSKLTLFILSAFLIAMVLAVLPAPRDAKATGPVAVTSSDPAGGASSVLAGSGRVFTVTFDETVTLSAGYMPFIYWYDPVESSWVSSSAPCTDVAVSGGNTLSFSLPTVLAAGLNTNTVYGIMLPGPDNTVGDNTGYAEDALGNRYPGTDYPSSYGPISTDLAGCWTFMTAKSYAAPSVQSMLPASGSANVDPNAEIYLIFDQPVSLNADPSTNIQILKFNAETSTWGVDKNIPVTDLVIAGGVSASVKIPAQSLANNEMYSVYIYGDIFTGEWSGLPGGRVRDTSLYFTTKTALTYIPGEHGHLESGGVSYNGAFVQQVAAGENGAEVTAVADTHYHFNSWSDSVTTANRTDTAPGNISVTAQFAIDTFTLDYRTDGNGTLTVGTQTGLSVYQQSVDYMGSGPEVTAVPNTGYHFVKWSDGKTEAARTDTSVQNISVTAEFAINAYALKYTAGTNGTLTVGAQTGLSEYQQSVNYMGIGPLVKAVPAAGYLFVKWSDGKTEAARTDIGVTDNINAAAEFALDVCTLEYLSGGNGTIEGSAAQTVARGGNGTAVTAKPVFGYHFVKWSDGKTNAVRQDTAVAGNISVTAIFEINYYTLKYSAGQHGSLTGDTDQSVEYGGSGTQVIAVPDENYHFVKWSDGKVASYRTDTNVTENKTVTAEFALNKFKVTFKDYDGTVLKTQYVAYGSDAEPPEDPERDGYTFSGWSGDYDDITTAVTIKAKYDINTYKVTFADYDGTELKTQNVIYGLGAVPPADPVREGYTFGGWDGDYTKITGTVKFTAQYKAHTFKVTFVDYDGAVIDEQDVENGKDAVSPADPARQGYTFTGWDKAFTGVTADITITAQYKASLVITGAGAQDGKPIAVVNTGGLDIVEVTFEGGKASVNPNGTLKLEFSDNVKAGDYKITFRLADGTTLTDTITITDEEVAMMAANTGKTGTPAWLWVAVGALMVTAAVLMVIFVRRWRYSG